MARPAKVWHRTDIGWWMVTLAGVKTRLVQGPDDAAHRELAEEKFVELRKLKRVAPEASTARTVDLVEAYLAWSRQHLSADTHRVNRYYCQLFAEHCGPVPARDLKPFHVTKWLSAMMSPDRAVKDADRRRREVEAGAVQKHLQGRRPKAWGPGTCHNARVTAFRVFSWAKEQGIMDVNPLAGMKRPKPPPRQRAMSEAEFDALHAHAGGAFADLLFALRETGARPKEVRDLTWPQVEDGRWVLGKHKTVQKTGKARVVVLTAAMRSLTDRLKGNGHAHVFLNTEGAPWTVNAVRLQMTRLRVKLGLADDLCAYLCRHGFGTRAIVNGVNPLVVAELMGHASLDMVSKVYVHLADEHAHLQAAVEQVSPARPASAAPGPTRRRAVPLRQPGKPGEVMPPPA